MRPPIRAAVGCKPSGRSEPGFISSYLEGYPQERLDALYAHADRLAQDLEQLTADIDRKLK